jgi:hypothetical protein
MNPSNCARRCCNCVSIILCAKSNGRVAPEASAGFLHAGFCLHQIGRTAEAKKLLLRGPTALLKEPVYYYNMGCYEVLLGNLQDAKVHLHISFKMDASFRDLAKKDPDLKPLHGSL